MRLLGHPVHPLLVAFPIALLALTPLWDAAAWLGFAPGLATVGHHSELAGLVGGALALTTGFIDFYALKDPTPKLTNTALTHAGLALGTLFWFVLAFVFRGDPAARPGLPVVGLELAGALCLVATGWFGGHLVFAHGVGVRPNESRRPPAPDSERSS